ncbi:MAG: hypothetical protein ACRDP6_29240 [Actinoallomurus sp.]
MAASVRTHTRRGKNGKSQTVHHHNRSTRGRHSRPGTGGLFSPRRALRNAKRAQRALRRHKKGAAVAFGCLATAEITGFLTLRGAAFALTTVGVIALGVAMLAAKATGEKEI